MTDTHSRRRVTRTERARHLYTTRTDEERLETETQESTPAYLPNETEHGAYRSNEPQYDWEEYTPNETQDLYNGYEPNEAADEYAEYLPNDPADEYAGYTPNEETDYSSYYSREGAAQENGAEPAFAPPPSMQQYMFSAQPVQDEETAEEEYTAQSNVYRPRQVTWAEDDREEAIAESELGYQVQEEEKPVRRKKRHVLRGLLIVLLLLALIGGAAWMFREPLADMLGIAVFVTQPTETPAALRTPEPIKAYDPAPAAAMADTARVNIARLSGTLEMENYIVTDEHVVTRNQRPDGSYDFYLFTAEGRLLCYFEGLSALDMIPQEFGGFYVKQDPWLITASGSALIRTSDVEAAIGETVFLHPMHRGWAVVESEVDGQANYVNADGKLMSSLWFSRTFPFTGAYTLAYVDTGSTVDDGGRYLLYVIGEDGSMTRWLSVGDMKDVVASVCGMAYMSDGALYRLPDTSAPVCRTQEITAYLNCDAMVIRDPVSGKYGLFVQGEQHYDFVYDAIRPLKSDLVWAEKTLGNTNALLTLKAVSSSNYPQPLSYSFVLEKDGQSEYVALSTASSYPIRLDGEF